MELHLVLVIGTLLIPAILAVMAADLIRSVMALIIGSVGLTLILFQLNAPIAGIFELSVGAGLITVLFILAISLIRPLTKEELTERKKQHYQRFYVLPIIILVLAIILFLNKEQWFNITPGKLIPETADVGHILWGLRGLDLIGQISILLVGVFGVVALFKRGKTE